MKKINKNLSTDDLEMLWIGSFRYYLGRMTISVHSYCDSLMEHWGDIPERAQFVIKRDLSEAIQFDDNYRYSDSPHKSLGHNCDSQKWREVMNFISKF